MEIIFATNNRHKLEEIGAMLDKRFVLKSLHDLELEEEIPEDYSTLEENALQKARYIFQKYRTSCIADDTGLEVAALNGAPGVFSARYSRIGAIQFPEMETAAGNIRKLLMALKGVQDRNARFRTVIALMMDEKEYLFEGIANGRITAKPSGSQGFGYDPIFQPDGYDMTFAEMDLTTKNRISHRAKAVDKLIEFLSGT